MGYPPALPAPRYARAAASVGGTLYAIGGVWPWRARHGPAPGEALVAGIARELATFLRVLAPVRPATFMDPGRTPAGLRHGLAAPNWLRPVRPTTLAIRLPIFITRSWPCGHGASARMSGAWLDRQPAHP